MSGDFGGSEQDDCILHVEWMWISGQQRADCDRQMMFPKDTHILINTTVNMLGQMASGTKDASELTLKQGNYPASPDEPNVITKVLKCGRGGQKRKQWLKGVQNATFGGWEKDLTRPRWL